MYTPRRRNYNRNTADIPRIHDLPPEYARGKQGKQGKQRLSLPRGKEANSSGSTQEYKAFQTWQEGSRGG